MNLNQIIKEEYHKILKEGTAIVNNNIVSYNDEKDLDTIKDDDDVKSIKKIDGTVIKEMAASTTVTYSLKPNHMDKLSKYDKRIKKDSIRTIVKKLVELLENKPAQSVNDLFIQIREIYKSQPEVLEKVKNHQNIKYYLWGGITSAKFNTRYLDKKDPVTGDYYTKGNLNAVEWTPFSRTKDAKALSDYEASLQLKKDNPEEFDKITQNRKKTANPITDNVILYKNLRGKYFANKKGNDESSVRQLAVIQKNMSEVLDIDVASAILYQWEKEYITLPLDNVLKDFALDNGLIQGFKSPTLTQKYRDIIDNLISTKKVHAL